MTARDYSRDSSLSPAASTVSTVALPVGEPVPGPGATAPDRRLLEGRGFSLHPLDPDRDTDDLFAGAGGDGEGARVWTYMLAGPFPDRDGMHAWLSSRAASDDPLYFTVVDNATQRRVGAVSFMNIVPAMRTIELGGIWYVPAAQRTRANTESMYLMLREAFDRLGYRRVEWKCDALNARSRKAALRLGFQFEGEFRQHLIVRGRNRDTAWFAMLDRDWPTIKERLQRWLQADTYRRLPAVSPRDWIESSDPDQPALGPAPDRS